MPITINDIETSKGGERYIKVKQRKTGKIVHIPIHPDVNDILLNRKKFPRSISP